MVLGFVVTSSTGIILVAAVAEYPAFAGVMLTTSGGADSRKAAVVIGNAAIASGAEVAMYLAAFLDEDLMDSFRFFKHGEGGFLNDTNLLLHGCATAECGTGRGATGVDLGRPSRAVDKSCVSHGMSSENEDGMDG